MNLNELLNSIFSAMINQAIANQNSQKVLLPQDQQEAQKKILDAMHDICENIVKIKPEYQSQVRDAAILKIATEIGWINGVKAKEFPD